MSEETIQGLSDKNMTPTQYFDAVKNLKHTITDEELLRIYDNCLELLEKYKTTGQKKGARRLVFHLETIEREREIVALGVDTFVYKDDIEYYIKEVADDVVKIIDLESYEREIPDDIVELIARVKDKFDQLYIIFTDYTGEAEKKVAQERRDKDPILFGTFKDKGSRAIIDRFYYLGDWVDEYCDLTLDRMIEECENLGNRKIAHTIRTPEDLEELKQQLGAYDSNKLTVAGNPVMLVEKKKSFFHKVKSIFSRKK